MTKSLKATLLSALVFPGAGHYFLKRYPQALLLAIAATGGLYFLLAETVNRSQIIADKIVNGEIAFDVATIAQIATDPSSNSNSQMLSIATWTILIAWIIAMVDSYRIGRSLPEQ
ncbi:MAG: hypothetical protein ACI9BW_000284 [Gammaproteobacteria bacterium]|jgi:hypothetical protein